MSKYDFDELGCVGAVGLVLAVVIIVVLAIVFNAWIFMVLFGAVASIFGWTTLSLGESVLVILLLSVIGGFFKKVG